MSSKQTPVPPECLADEFGSVGAVSDQLRLAGLDHAGRLQKGRLGATERRLALTRARRPQDTVEIARLETTLRTERRVEGAYGRAVTRAEIDIPKGSADTAVLHGLVIGEDRAPAGKVTVAAARADGSVRRFTCTDPKGYFRMDLSPGDNARETVFLQVSDAEQAVLYRGQDGITLAPGAVVYREIKLAGDRLEPCPLPPDRATMPRLLDLPESEALLVLQKVGLAVTQRRTQTAPNREGLIISQEPPAGTAITGETEVTIVVGVAEGGQTVIVPDVVGQNQDIAQATLKEAGFEIGRVTGQPSDVEPGLVLQQVPAGGTRVEAGSAVSLVIAVERPDPRVQVPNVVSQPLDKATEILAEVGLDVGRITFRDDDRVGQVLDQAPEAGSRVAKETPVNLVVGRRAQVERVEIPRLLRLTLSGAKEVLEASRLKLGEVQGNRAGVVVSQKPPAGRREPVGSAVSVELKRRGSGPVDGDPTRGRTSFVDKAAKRIAADPKFPTLGVPRERIRDILISTGIGNAAELGRLAKRDNQEIRVLFDLRNLNQGRSLRRMLREAAEKLG